MQERHINRWQYFTELANTSRKFYIDYLKPHIPITPDTKVLEIGCGEGGNLLPFAEMGCYVKGIDLNAGQIENAKNFFAKEGQKGDFCAENFLNYPPQSNESKLFDIVLIHDCVEHIEQPDKEEFFTKRHRFFCVSCMADAIWRTPANLQEQNLKTSIYSSVAQSFV